MIRLTVDPATIKNGHAAREVTAAFDIHTRHLAGDGSGRDHFVDREGVMHDGVTHTGHRFVKVGVGAQHAGEAITELSSPAPEDIDVVIIEPHLVRDVEWEPRDRPLLRRDDRGGLGVGPDVEFRDCRDVAHE